MPTSANITTAGDIAFTLPVGTWGVRVINESDTLIRRLLGQPATTSGASLGLPLAAGAGETLVFKQPLKQAVAYCAIHAGSGNKTLTYEIITQPTQGGSGPSSSAGGGASNALLLEGASAATLGSLTAATAATGGLFYGTQGGADRKFTLTAAGAAMIEAANAAAQQALLGITGGGAIGLGGFTLTVPATGTAALLGVAQTFTAANIFSVNGAASTPSALFSGSIFTGGSAATTHPLVLIQPAGTVWANGNTNGTAFGVNLPTGFDGDAVVLKYNGGGAFFRVNYEAASGAVTFGTSGAGVTFYAGNFYPEAADSLGLGRAGVSLWNACRLTSAAPLNWNGDAGFARVGAAAMKATDGGAGLGSIDASAYKVGGVAGVDFSGVATNLTIVKGIITAAS